MSDPKPYSLVDRILGTEAPDKSTAASAKAHEALRAHHKDVERRRAQDVADAAQGAGTFKGDLVADEVRARNAAQQERIAKERAELDDKFGAAPSDDDRKIANFLAIEIAEVRRQRSGSNSPRRR